ncbi:MAG: ABC transporter ATP-binding protein [Desulfuromonadales bacterium]|nr:ABC transporter ATP-binding protein [Desulfuromonadales bacterium]
MNPILIERISKSYKGKKGQRIQALSELTLEVKPGEILGVLGPNGAGKSTTIKILTGQIPPDSGTVEILGAMAGSMQARSAFGYLPENPAFYDFLTPREYLHLVGAAFAMSVDRIKSESDRVLALLDLQTDSDRPLRGFSKGMVQRLGLAQALLHDPDLFIWDEPMSGLDPMGRALVKGLMLELKRRGKTIFFSTHVTADVEAVCDRVAVIVGGRLQALNDVQEILADGIEGYQVQILNPSAELAARFSASEDNGVMTELYVSREALPGFLDLASRGGEDIRLIEPRRRNLEQFFLDIVSRNQR